MCARYSVRSTLKPCVIRLTLRSDTYKSSFRPGIVNGKNNMAARRDNNNFKTTKIY